MREHHTQHLSVERARRMQFYSLQTTVTIAVPDARVERTTMANGRPAARAGLDLFPPARPQP